jgi:predicted NAD/FAD-binding protein
MLVAYLLCGEHEVMVYEANDYIGGHTNTIDATCSTSGSCA